MRNISSLVMLLLLHGALPATPLLAQTTAAVPPPAHSPAAVVPARPPGTPALTAVASLKERAAQVLGTWTGPLMLPASSIIIRITISRSASGLSAMLDLPSARPGSATRKLRLFITQRQDSLLLREPEMNMSFPCVLSPDGTVLSGTWTQVVLRQLVVLGRVVPASPVAAEPALVPPPATRSPRVASAKTKPAAPVRGVRRVKMDSKWENGDLENDRPVGVWNFYLLDHVGDYVLSRTYNYDTSQLTFARPENEGYDVLLPNGEWKRMILAESPWFIGPHNALARITSKGTYSADALRARVEGTVFVSFVVDTLGRVSNPQLVRGLGHGLDEEAMRLVSTIPNTFTPGRDGGRAVTVRRMLPIFFKFQ